MFSGNRSLLYLLPAVVFVILCGFLFRGLSLDPSLVPTALIDKAVPKFDLAPLDSQAGALTSADLSGEVTLVNVFASWCGPCRIEHPLLMEIAEMDNINLYGINYKDDPVVARDWLTELGDPFARIGADSDGRVSIELGVYGVPETFLIDREGRIRYKHVGPISEDDWNRELVPLIRSLRQ
ncbi:MAG: DsbE family thiol:disulfide interchange protein [Pseudomonadota bacterium]|nr:DsbE family thiol:disulfide interchange protein [Pseudomonadota bacterium]